jgi:hypothetical protein
MIPVSARHAQVRTVPTAGERPEQTVDTRRDEDWTKMAKEFTPVTEGSRPPMVHFKLEELPLKEDSNVIEMELKPVSGSGADGETSSTVPRVKLMVTEDPEERDGKKSIHVGFEGSSSPPTNIVYNPHDLNRVEINGQEIAGSDLFDEDPQTKRPVVKSNHFKRAVLAGALLLTTFGVQSMIPASMKPMSLNTLNTTSNNQTNQINPVFDNLPLDLPISI